MAGLLRHAAVSVMAASAMLATLGVTFGSITQPAAASTFSSGQVFASVGQSTVNVYDPTSGNQLGTLTDATGEPYVAGTAWDAHGNLYVADDTNGEISVFNPDGTLDTQWNNGAFTSGATTGNGIFAYGLTNPLSLVFDSSGNLYVGQQTTPYIAQFSPSGARQPDIGPVQTQLYGADWIDLSSDQCTFYYTTEGTNVLTYDKCTNTQGPNFNVASFPKVDAATNLPVQDFQLKILANGEVLVADSNAILLLDQTGHVVQTYPCSALPSCGGQLFAVSVDPSGNSFWTGDSASGNIYEINIVSGNLMQNIATHSGTLYGLSVLNQLEVATSGTTVAATPSQLTLQPVTGNFSSPTPVTAVLTNPSTNTPLVNEPVTFTLNGTQTCTATTNAAGVATCLITAGEPAATYTLTASFAGDSSTSSPIGSNSSSTAFTVTPDTSQVTYTGPTTAVNGAPLTLSGTLTTNTPTAGTPLPTKVVTFTIGSGSTAQSCSGTTDASGNVSCTIPSVNQPTSSVGITTSFAGDSYATSASATTPATVTEPTSLLVNSATSPYSSSVTVSGVLTDSVTNLPVVGQQVTLRLNATESCTATTDVNGVASCSITPTEPAGTYPLTASFAGNPTLPLQLASSSSSANFVVTPQATALTYTGPTLAQNGQPLAVSGVLTSTNGGTGVGGRLVTFTLGSGATAQSCTATSTTAGAVSCVINVTGQPPGPIPVTDTFAGDTHYQTTSAGATVNLPEGTQLSVASATGPYGGPTTVTGTLVNTYTNQPVPNETVTLTLNGTQTCSATTNANGVASCAILPTEPSGNYTLTGTFAGDNGQTPQLLPTSSSSIFTVTPATTSFTDTGPSSVTNGQNVTVSGVLTTNQPTAGTDVSGRTVTFTLGTGGSAQNCTGVTNAAGVASCTLTNVNQSTSTAGITATYGGDSYYQSSSTSSSVSLHTPTRLVVNAGTSDFADATTVSATLTNAVTGAPIAGRTVTLALNSAQSCSTVTNASGVASCTVTPNEPAGTYALSAAFAGDSSASPPFLASSGTNNFIVTLEESAITYTGPSVAVSGMSFTLSSTLTTDGSPLGGRSVLMTLGSGATAQSCTGVTNAAGAATCTIPTVNQVAGSVPVTVAFASDGYYRPANASGTVTTASLPSTGSFVVGDVSAGKPTLGTQVNFWGSQLWKTNQFSGVNNAPASMKGYIDSAPNLNLGCGGTWTSDPGNSSHPPATIPVNMVVVVSSHISQSGSTESGDIKHLVIVAVSPGYGPAPGHDGYGKIIATIC